MNNIKFNVENIGRFCLEDIPIQKLEVARKFINAELLEEKDLKNKENR